MDISTAMLVRDLDLWITDASGTYHPWTLNPLSPNSPAVQTQANHVDHPTNEDNTAVISGVYHPAAGDVFVHGRGVADTISASGNLDVTFNGVVYTYLKSATDRLFLDRFGPGNYCS